MHFAYQKISLLVTTLKLFVFFRSSFTTILNGQAVAGACGVSDTVLQFSGNTVDPTTKLAQRLVITTRINTLDADEISFNFAYGEFLSRKPGFDVSALFKKTCKL